MRQNMFHYTAFSINVVGLKLQLDRKVIDQTE